jgi:hypothetical protein|uniref:Uncharacterized protein n=1 Tax=viral metagenome TaxID=1070528 RepID=A0A6C0AL51_9ZZZZ
MCKCEKKRWFLPIVLIVFLILIEEVRDFIYLPIIVFISFSILFWNYPWLVYRTVSKPFYYEDLFIDESKLPNYEISDKIKKKFEYVLIYILIITNSLLVSALSDYWLYRLNHLTNYFQIAGVTGGIIKIFQIINNLICRLLLKIMKRCVNDEKEKEEKLEELRREKEIELKNIFWTNTLDIKKRPRANTE